MSFVDFQDRLARSIKVVGLPQPYDKEEVLSNLKNAGTIEDIKLGLSEMIVTFSNSNEKDLSKMYDGCPIGEYTLKLEDVQDFDLNTGEPKPHHEEKVEEKHHEPEPVVTHHQEEQSQYSDYVEKHREPEHHEEPKHHHEEPKHHHEEPKHVEEPVHHKEPEPAPVTYEEPVVHHEPVHHKEPEPVHVEPEPVQQHQQHHEPAPAPVVEKKEVHHERKSEVVNTEKRAEPVVAAVIEKAVVVEKPRVSEVPAAHHERGGDSTKELLRELQNTNLPARAGLPSGDAFNAVTKRSYLLIFTVVWGLQLFLRSVF